MILANLRLQVLDKFLFLYLDHRRKLHLWCRYYINKPRKLAIHKWHFSNIEVDDNRCLNMNCVASPIPGWNFWLGVGANPCSRVVASIPNVLSVGVKEITAFRVVK